MPLFSKQNILLYYRERTVFLLSSGALLIQVITYIYILMTLKLLPADYQFLPLHYNTTLGIDFLGSRLRLFGLTSVITAILIVNFLLGYLIFAKDKYLSYYLNLLSLLASICLLLWFVFLRLYSF